MTQYAKPQVEAKNTPSGSYVAGCPAISVNDTPDPDCKQCESAK